ncbi:hypothetical protein ACFV4P_35155 [Kitasatospora sp. NPDC059795]
MHPFRFALLLSADPLGPFPLRRKPGLALRNPGLGLPVERYVACDL